MSEPKPVLPERIPVCADRVIFTFKDQKQVGSPLLVLPATVHDCDGAGRAWLTVTGDPRVQVQVPSGQVISMPDMKVGNIPYDPTGKPMTWRWPEDARSAVVDKRGLGLVH